MLLYLEAFEPKSVNSLLNIIGVNSLRLGGLHLQDNEKNNISRIYIVFFIFYSPKPKIRGMGATAMYHIK